MRTVSPYARLPDLQRLVYSSSAESPDVNAHQLELHELVEAMAVDQAATRVAVESTMVSTAEPALSEQPHSDQSVTALSAENITPPSAFTRRSLGALSIAVVLGVILGATLESARHTVEADLLEGPPGAAALSIFETVQDDTDLPAHPTDPNFLTESFRLMLDGDGYRIYAARQLNADVCIVALSTPTTYVSSCAPSSEFPTSGLTIGWSDAAARIYNHTSDGAVFIDEGGLPPSMFATWRQDGQLRTGLVASRG